MKSTKVQTLGAKVKSGISRDQIMPYMFLKEKILIPLAEHTHPILISTYTFFYVRLSWLCRNCLYKIGK